jgi:ketosteroid isomerase-like protein
MSDSADIALVRRLYESGMAPEVTAEIMAPDLVWDITPGFPYGGINHGWENVAQNFFGRLSQHFDSFAAGAEEFYVDDEDHVFVFVVGHYHATPQGGSAVAIRFAHLWTIRGGKLARLIQTADTHILQQALAA